MNAWIKYINKFTNENEYIYAWMNVNAWMNITELGREN